MKIKFCSETNAPEEPISGHIYMMTNTLHDGTGRIYLCVEYPKGYKYLYNMQTGDIRSSIDPWGVPGANSYKDVTDQFTLTENCDG
jgi:hypothetical protein